MDFPRNLNQFEVKILIENAMKNHPSLCAGDAVIADYHNLPGDVITKIAGITRVVVVNNALVAWSNS